MVYTRKLYLLRKMSPGVSGKSGQEGNPYHLKRMHKKTDDQHGFLVILDSGGGISSVPLGTNAELVQIGLQSCNRPAFTNRPETGKYTKEMPE